MSQHWERLGLVLKPKSNIPWLKTHAGPTCAVLVSGTIVDLYVTGRDSKNRSLIGRVRIDINNPKDIIEISMTPVLGLGQLGAFDENGVSYPTIIHHQGAKWMYYVGWMPTRLTPFQLNVGLAIEKFPDQFVRYSRAPILARNNEDFLGIASSFVARESDRWRIWYTSFYDWGQRGQPLHRYHIKHADSIDGINWQRNHQVCIQARDEEEIAINRPSVLHIGKHYHMWYCVRGTHYRIGYAVSYDGVRWRRRDSEFDLPMGDEKWDAKAQAYPHVICLKDYLYMFYCGNVYGRDGLGLARLPVSALSQVTI